MTTKTFQPARPACIAAAVTKRPGRAGEGHWSAGISGLFSSVNDYTGTPPR